MFVSLSTFPHSFRVSVSIISEILPTNLSNSYKNSALSVSCAPWTDVSGYAPEQGGWGIAVEWFVNNIKDSFLPFPQNSSCNICSDVSSPDAWLGKCSARLCTIQVSEERLRCRLQNRRQENPAVGVLLPWRRDWLPPSCLRSSDKSGWPEGSSAAPATASIEIVEF